MPGVDIVSDFADGRAALRRRRYGVIEMRQGRLQRIVLRPWPKLVSWPDLRLLGIWQHGLRTGDVCRLYYNQPRGSERFLALKYVLSYRTATLATFRGALCVLDAIAQLKQCDAIVCDVANLRISDRLLERWGWEPHCPSRWHRHFIKRFYGTYPELPNELLG